MKLKKQKKIERVTDSLSTTTVVLSFILAQVCAIAGLVSTNLYFLGLLSFFLISGVILSRVKIKPLLKFFLIQCLIISLLHLLRFGVATIPAGLLVSWKLALAYTPFVILNNCISNTDLTAAFSKFLPLLTAFVLGACLRFFPKMFLEIKEIYHLQKMRGAALSAKKMFKWVFWHDLVYCLLVPFLAQCFVLAHQTALAARARQFGKVISDNKELITFNHLKQALTFGFCALGLAVFRIALRLGLKMTGHSMLPTVFFLMIARGTARYFGAAVYTSLLAGILLTLIGGNKSGLTIIYRLLLYGFLVDLFYLIPLVRRNILFSALAGALIGSSRIIFSLIGSVIAGLDFKSAMILQSYALLGNAGFGALGGALVPLAVRRLNAFGIIDFAPLSKRRLKSSGFYEKENAE